MNLNVNDPSNYKSCSKKSYEVYVCKPPQNTVVTNKLEHQDVIATYQFFKNGFLTQNDFMKLTEFPQEKEAVAHLVRNRYADVVNNDRPFVLSGVLGELRAISGNELASTYTFLKDGKPVEINGQTLKERSKNGILDWTLVRVKKEETMVSYMAMFIPVQYKMTIPNNYGGVSEVNGNNINHGKGDFIVCTKNPDGSPNFNNRFVVNGIVFANTYDNRGWSDCLDTSYITEVVSSKLPNLTKNAVRNPDSIMTDFQNIDIVLAKCEDLFERKNFSFITDKADDEFYAKAQEYFDTAYNSIATLMVRTFNESRKYVYNIMKNVQESKNMKVFELLSKVILYHTFMYIGSGKVKDDKLTRMFLKSIHTTAKNGEDITISVNPSDYSVDSMIFMHFNSNAFGLRPNYLVAVGYGEERGAGKCLYVRSLKDRNNHIIDKDGRVPKQYRILLDAQRGCIYNVAQSAARRIAVNSEDITDHNMFDHEVSRKVDEFRFSAMTKFQCLHCKENMEHARQTNNDYALACTSDNIEFNIDCNFSDHGLRASATYKGNSMNNAYDLTDVDNAVNELFIDVMKMIGVSPARMMFENDNTWIFFKGTIDSLMNHRNSVQRHAEIARKEFNKDKSKIKVTFNIIQDGYNANIGSFSVVIDFNSKEIDPSFVSYSGELTNKYKMLAGSNMDQAIVSYKFYNENGNLLSNGLATDVDPLIGDVQDVLRMIVGYV